MVHTRSGKDYYFCGGQINLALVNRMNEAKTRGERFAVSVWTGASTAPELDGALAEVEGIDLRMPYQSDPVSRAKINAGLMDYMDIHLSHVAQMVWEGFFGHMDIAVIEVAGITADGELIPSSSVGNNKTWIDQADKVILEVNSAQPIEAQQIIDHCAHPDYRPALQDYLDRATAGAAGKHTPHLLDEALSWHARFLQQGSMQPA